MLVSMTAFWVVIQELLNITRPARLVEIGGDEGVFTQKLCEWARQHQAYVHVIETKPKDKLKLVMEQYPSDRLHVGPSLEILPTMEKAACFVIDGDHNYYTVYNELKMIDQHHQPDLILLHDIGWPWGRRDVYYDLNTIPEEYRRDPVTDPAIGIVPGHQGILPDRGFSGRGKFAFAKGEGGPRNGVLTAVQDFLIENKKYELFTIDCAFGLGILLPKLSPYYAQIVSVLHPYVANPLITLLEQDRLQTFVNSFKKPDAASLPASALPTAKKARPLISVVIAIHNMQRVAPRTLHSFTAAYQDISADSYEVIVVENGSDQPLSRRQVEAFGPNFRYFSLPDASPSPVGALNFGVKQSKGQMVGLMIDGAHLVTPGVLKYALRALKAYTNPVVSILASQLGPKLQRLSIREGYSEQVEDDLLQQINWPEAGYKLFGISTLTGVNADGWFLPMMESNCVFLLRRTYDEIGGFDKRFDAPGGGMANLDFYYRLCVHPLTELIILLGEGSFHQIHDGVSTNNVDDQLFNDNLAYWKEQYKTIRGEAYQPSTRRPECWGYLAPAAIPLLDYSAQRLIHHLLK